MSEKILVHESRDLGTDRRVVQKQLQLGLALSFVLMAVGFLLAFFTAGERVESRGYRLDEFLGGAQNSAATLMFAGVLVLALTPPLRVLMLTFLWGREKDWKFVVISVIVMITLLVSVWLGGA